MIGRGGDGRSPQPGCGCSGCGLAGRRVAVSFGPRCAGAFKQRLVLCVNERSRKLAAPDLPAQPVTPVLQPSSGGAVQVRQVCHVAPATSANGMAAVQTTVSHDRLGRHDVTCAQRRAELVEHPGDIGHR